MLVLSLKNSFLARVMWSLFVFCVLVPAPIVNAASIRDRAALESNPSLSYAENTILIRYKDNTLPAQKQQARKLVNGTIIRGYGIVNALEHLRLGPGRNVEKAIQTLEALPFVRYAEPDYVLRPDTNDMYYGLQWGLENTGQDIRGTAGIYDADINANLAWSTTTGDASVVVAVIDTGVDYTHIDLNENIWVNSGEISNNGIDDDGNGFIDDIHGYDFYSNDSNPIDEEGHGTHVAGTICAESNNNIGISGVAWHCNIMALRFLGPNGGYTSDAISALDYAVAKGVRISNNSWGGGGYSQGLYDAINNAAANKHLFLAAAGNGGTDGIGDNTDTYPHYPSSYTLDNIIAVAATNNLDQLAGFSNFGLNSVDVGAPGVNIVSTMLGSYYWSSGTSMATPHVSGVAALIMSMNPDWGYVEIKDRLLTTTRPIDALTGKTVTGGVINADAATQLVVSTPNSPSDLTTTTISHSQIDLEWNDNSDNELGFLVERSQDSGSTWSETASLTSNVTLFSDTELDAETTYFYRVSAFNSVGSSGYSNLSSTTTAIAPSGQEIFASNELFSTGTIQGNYTDTWNDDGIVESVTERQSGGKPSSRYSYAEHVWVFTVPVGSASLHLNAWSDISSDGDNFEFSYSLDGNSYQNMFTISGGDSTSWHDFNFPPNTNGTVYVKVIDSDRTRGNLELNTVFIDKMFIQSETNGGEITTPSAPISLTSSATTEGQIDLLWADTSSDENGFEVERSLSGNNNWSLLGTVNTDINSFADNTVLSSTTYDYRVRAFNGAGYSEYSNITTETSLAFTGLELSGISYLSGWQYVDLTWNNSSMLVDIYRDGNLIATVSGGAYTDGKIAKGTGDQYTYQICETNTEQCSNVFVASF